MGLHSANKSTIVRSLRPGTWLASFRLLDAVAPPAAAAWAERLWFRMPPPAPVAPVPEAEDLPYTPPPSAAPAPATDNLPTADEVSARGGLPALHLDLHVYATAPQQRFIFVNSRKYREGDALQEGPVVEQITSTGAVLSYRGARFKLTND